MWLFGNKKKENIRDKYLLECKNNEFVNYIDDVVNCENRINDNYSNPEQEEKGENLCHKAADVEFCLNKAFEKYLNESKIKFPRKAREFKLKPSVHYKSSVQSGSSGGRITRRHKNRRIRRRRTRHRRHR